MNEILNDKLSEQNQGVRKKKKHLVDMEITYKNHTIKN